jgi:hypothetical protein
MLYYFISIVDVRSIAYHFCKPNLFRHIFYFKLKFYHLLFCVSFLRQSLTMYPRVASTRLSFSFLPQPPKSLF